MAARFKECLRMRGSEMGLRERKGAIASAFRNLSENVSALNNSKLNWKWVESNFWIVFTFSSVFLRFTYNIMKYYCRRLFIMKIYSFEKVSD